MKPPTVPPWYEELTGALATHGLVPRGAFHPGPGDEVPGEARTLVLVGNVGLAMWRAFAAARPDGTDPLDSWSRTVLERIAGRLGAVALFPFGGRPWLPFQRWAMRAEPVAPSPLGILIHPDYGLWHGYRGALAIPDRLPLPPRDGRPAPCASCAERPCLAACPVGAFADGGYDVESCSDWLRSPRGIDCLAGSCAARRACPVGRDHAYGPDQAEFHMRAFLAAREPTETCR